MLLIVKGAFYLRVSNTSSEVPTESKLTKSDLKHITEMQAARIQQLESMLSVSSQQFWPNANFTHVSQQPDLATLAEHSQLDILQTSPDGGSTSSLHAWPHSSSGLMAFQPSPTDHSSGSNNFRRSSSLSTSDSAEKQDSTSPNAVSPHGRKPSEVELQLSMSGMDIDSMFLPRDELRGSRW